MTFHSDSHPQSGKKVLIKEGVTDPVQNQVVPGAVFEIEDWVDRMDPVPTSWQEMNGNWAAMHYGYRGGLNQLPIDDEVVYGHIVNADGVHLGHMVHVSELGEEVAQ